MVKQVPKENASYKSLLLIILDSIVKVKKRYYPQTFLEESKYELKWRTSSDEMMIIMSLIMNLTMNLAMILIKNLTMNKLLKAKTYFDKNRA